MGNTYTLIYIQTVFAFGAFSYSHSQLGAVARYIRNQQAHHTRRSFKEEYFALLRKFDVAFDEKYLFKWIEIG